MRRGARHGKKGDDRLDRTHKAFQEGAAAASKRLVPAAASAAAAAVACTGKGGRRFNDESHVADVDIHRTHLLKKGFADAECKAACFERSVLVIWLIQSQGKTWAASAAGGEVNADPRFRAVLEKSLQFVLGA